MRGQPLALKRGRGCDVSDHVIGQSGVQRSPRTAFCVDDLLPRVRLRRSGSTPLG